MKFLEKFVLLPIERYERLVSQSKEVNNLLKKTNDSVSITKGANLPVSGTISQNNTSSDIERGTKRNISQFNESSVGETVPQPDSSQIINPTITKPDTESNSVSNNKTHSQKSSSPKIKTNLELNKIPSRPPGIPNKKQKLKFKWETLF